MIKQQRISIVKHSESGDQIIDISKEKFTIGSRAGVDLRVSKEGDVKEENCRIETWGSDISIRTSKRGNPTFRNGKKVCYRQHLEDGDILGVGGSAESPCNQFVVRIEELRLPTVKIQRQRKERSSLGAWQTVHSVVEVPAREVKKSADQQADLRRNNSRRKPSV